ncbi:MAG: hypothetical protein JXR94_05855, partial [Candidatus Hydrogenedentes bacterium]|nr:hypothetical protein [Candidatus Hydrogenedentota bacterium]
MNSVAMGRDTRWYRLAALLVVASLGIVMAGCGGPETPDVPRTAPAPEPSSTAAPAAAPAPAPEPTATLYRDTWGVPHIYA